MAIVSLGKSTCPICGQTLCEGEELVGIPDFHAPGPLEGFVDAVMHRRCFSTWEKADDFRAALAQAGLPTTL